MSRSIKKGPFVQPELLKRIQKMNESGEKKSSRPGAVLQRSSRTSSATRLLFTTDVSTFLFM